MNWTSSLDSSSAPFGCFKSADSVLSSSDPRNLFLSNKVNGVFILYEQEGVICTTVIIMAVIDRILFFMWLILYHLSTSVNQQLHKDQTTTNDSWLVTQENYNAVRGHEIWELSMTNQDIYQNALREALGSGSCG